MVFLPLFLFQPWHNSTIWHWHVADRMEGHRPVEDGCVVAQLVGLTGIRPGLKIPSKRFVYTGLSSVNHTHLTSCTSFKPKFLKMYTFCQHQMIDDHLCHLFLSLRLNRSSISLASCLVNYGRGFMFDWKQKVCLFIEFRSPNRLYQKKPPQNDWIDEINLVKVEDDCVSSPDVGIRISQLAISEKEFPQV